MRLWTRVTGDILVRIIRFFCAVIRIFSRLIYECNYKGSSLNGSTIIGGSFGKRYICSFEFGLWKSLEPSEKQDIDEKPTEAKSLSGLGAQVDQKIDEAVAGDKTQSESQAELMPAQEDEEIQESVMITDIDLI